MPPSSVLSGLFHVVASLLLVSFVAAVAVTAYEMAMDGHIYQGVRLGGVDVGGLSPSEALARVGAARNAAAVTSLTLQAGAREWSVAPARLGYSLSAPDSVADAYALGRTGNLIQRLSGQAHLLLDGASLPLTGVVDDATLRASIRALAVQVDRPARPALPALTPGGVRVLPPADGLQLDQAAAERMIASALSAGGASTVDLPVTAVRAPASLIGAQREAARLARLLAARIVLVAPGHRWPLTRARLVKLLHVTAMQRGGTVIYADYVDRTAATGFVWPRAASLDRPGRDAVVTYRDGIVTLVPGRPGNVVDQGAAVAALIAAIERGRDAEVRLPFVNGPTVPDAEAAAVAARLRRTLRTTVVWLPGRHWAIAPAQIARALTLVRVPSIDGARLVARLDAAAIASYLPGSAALAAVAPRHATTIRRGGRIITVAARPGRRANYAALAAEMLAAPPGRAVYHLPLISD